MKKIFTLIAMAVAMTANAQTINFVEAGVALNTEVASAAQSQEGFELSTINGLSVKICGATAWTVRAETGAQNGTFTAQDGVTYNKGYIQGGTNGMHNGLMHSNGVSSHIQIVSATDAKIWIAAKYGKNKPIWSAACTAQFAEEELNYSDMSALLTTYKGDYILDDGTGVGKTEAANDTYAALPLNVKAGEVNFFWVSGSKVMLCGITLECPSSIQNVENTVAPTVRKVATANGIQIVKGNKFFNVAGQEL